MSFVNSHQALLLLNQGEGRGSWVRWCICICVCVVFVFFCSKETWELSSQEGGERKWGFGCICICIGVVFVFLCSEETLELLNPEGEGELGLVVYSGLPLFAHKLSTLMAKINVPTNLMASRYTKTEWIKKR